jgi:hypothetical protein
MQGIFLDGLNALPRTEVVQEVSRHGPGATIRDVKADLDVELLKVACS